MEGPGTALPRRPRVGGTTVRSRIGRTEAPEERCQASVRTGIPRSAFSSSVKGLVVYRMITIIAARIR